jgi:DNA-binding transcriptional ArsR family regulator/uncharacterized protein YndB with AHSA1/START domain
LVKRIVVNVPFDEDAALDLLGDSTRRTLIAMLGQGPSSVAELAAQLPISRPAVSQHLMLLKSCGLIRSRAEGTRRIYELDTGRAEALVDRLHRAAFPWPPTRRRRPPPRADDEVDTGSVTTSPLIASTRIQAGQDRCFTVFTAGLGSWWPRAFHLGATEPAGVFIEPWTGGRWYERASSGDEYNWGRITTWDRPRLLIATWEIDSSWLPDPDPSHASEVVVSCQSVGRKLTTVAIEHRGFDRLVGGTDVHEALAAGETWSLLLARFARAAEADTPPNRRVQGHGVAR